LLKELPGFALVFLAAVALYEKILYIHGSQADEKGPGFVLNRANPSMY
jgi:hypothetical protein